MDDSTFDLRVPDASLDDLDGELRAYTDLYNDQADERAAKDAQALLERRELARRIIATPGTTIDKDDFRRAVEYGLIPQESNGWVDYARRQNSKKSAVDAARLKQGAAIADEHIEIARQGQRKRLVLDHIDGRREMRLYRFHNAGTYAGWLSAQVKASDLLLSAYTPSAGFVSGFYAYLTQRRFVALSVADLRIFEQREEQVVFLRWIVEGMPATAVTDPVYFTPAEDSDPRQPKDIKAPERRGPPPTPEKDKWKCVEGWYAEKAKGKKGLPQTEYCNEKGVGQSTLGKWIVEYRLAFNVKPYQIAPARLPESNADDETEQ